MIELLDNPDPPGPWASAARRRVNEEFNLPKMMMALYGSIYDELLGRDGYL